MAGRPRDPNKLHFKSVGLTSSDWQWLETWFPDGNVTHQLGSLMDRVKRFWPNGPYDPPRCSKCGRFIAPGSPCCENE